MLSPLAIEEQKMETGGLQSLGGGVQRCAQRCDNFDIKAQPDSPGLEFRALEVLRFIVF